MKNSEIKKFLSSKLLPKWKLHDELQKQKIKLLDDFCSVIWNDVMNESEHRLWLKNPNEFNTYNYSINLICPSLLTKEGNSELEKPVENICDTYFGILSHLSLYQYSICNISWHNILPEIEKFPDIFTQKQFIIDNVSYKYDHNTGIWSTVKNNSRPLKITLPNFGGLTLTNEFLNSNSLDYVYSDEGVYKLKKSNTTEQLRESLIKFINLYRKEVTILKEFIELLELPGVGIGKLKKFYPEILV